MEIHAWIKAKWPVLLVGILVVPVCLQLLFGVPYDIYLNRDIQLNGKPVTGTAVSERDVRFKGGTWHRMVKVEYEIDDRRYSDEYALDDLKIGETLALHYSPVSPGQSIVGNWPSQPWNENLFQRLLTSWTLGLIFSVTWLGLLLKKPDPSTLV